MTRTFSKTWLEQRGGDEERSLWCAGFFVCGGPLYTPAILVVLVYILCCARIHFFKPVSWGEKGKI